MGITVLSAAGTGPLAQLASSLLPAAAVAGDFSALLGQQLSGLPALDPGQAAALTVPDRTATDKDEGADSGEDASALAAIAGFLPGFMAPPVANAPAPAGPAATGQGEIAALSGERSPARQSPGLAEMLGQKDSAADPAALPQDPSLQAAAAATAPAPAMQASMAPAVAAEAPVSPQKPGLAGNALSAAALRAGRPDRPGDKMPADIRVAPQMNGVPMPGAAIHASPGAAAWPERLAADVPRAEPAIIAAEPSPASGNGSGFAAALAAQAAPAQPDVGATQAPAQIAAPLHDGRWAQDFGDKVVWLAKNDQQVAQININPPQLGPMHITLNLNGDQASALFVSPHAEVRQAITDAMPQLREMLADAGISLGQAEVGTQLPRQNGEGPQQFAAPPRFDGDKAILHGDSGQATAAPPPAALRSGRGLVDLFA